MKVDKRLIVPHQKYVARDVTITQPRKEYRPEPDVQIINSPPRIVVLSVDWDAKNPALDTTVLFLDHRDYHAPRDHPITYRTMDGDREEFNNSYMMSEVQRELQKDGAWLHKGLLVYRTLKSRPLPRQKLLEAAAQQHALTIDDASLALGLLIQHGAACYRAGDGFLKTTKPKNLL